jgi:hypothetical protein
MELRVQSARFGKFAPKGGNDSGMRRESQITLQQERFGGVEHRIISARSANIPEPLSLQQLSGDQVFARLLRKLLGVGLYIAIASRRALSSSGLPPVAQRAAETKMVEITTSCSSERPATTSEVRWSNSG